MLTSQDETGGRGWKERKGAKLRTLVNLLIKIQASSDPANPDLLRDEIYDKEKLDYSVTFEKRYPYPTPARGSINSNPRA